MNREKRKFSGFILLGIDLALTLLAFVIAYSFREVYLKAFKKSDQYIAMAILIVPVWYFLIRIFGFHIVRITKSFAVFIWEAFLIVFLGFSALIIIEFTFKFNDISRLVFLLFCCLDFVFLIIAKAIALKILTKSEGKNNAGKNAILIIDEGNDYCLENIINSVYGGVNILGIITDSYSIKDVYGGTYNILPPDLDIKKFLDENPVDEVICCKEVLNQGEILPLIYICKEVGVSFTFHSDLFNLIATQGRLNYLDEMILVTLPNKPSDSFSLSIKSFLDYIFSVIFLIVFSPFFLLIALGVKLSSKGPVFFVQKRVGLRGRIFKVYKFRTMIVDAEKQVENLQNQNEVDGPVFKIKNDPRVTPLGRFLRKTSLDEIPQFFNVLQGEMSIVGPRPPLPSEVQKYERWQLRRLSMKPGITCIWQVSGRNNVSFFEWMKMDLQYIDSWSLQLDAIIFFKTIQAVFKMTGR